MGFWRRHFSKALFLSKINEFYKCKIPTIQNAILNCRKNEIERGCGIKIF